MLALMVFATSVMAADSTYERQSELIRILTQGSAVDVAQLNGVMPNFSDRSIDYSQRVDEILNAIWDRLNELEKLRKIASDTVETMQADEKVRVLVAMSVLARAMPQAKTILAEDLREQWYQLRRSNGFTKLCDEPTAVPEVLGIAVSEGLNAFVPVERGAVDECRQSISRRASGAVKAG